MEGGCHIFVYEEFHTDWNCIDYASYIEDWCENRRVTLRELQVFRDPRGYVHVLALWRGAFNPVLSGIVPGFFTQVGRDYNVEDLEGLLPDHYNHSGYPRTMESDSASEMSRILPEARSLLSVMSGDSDIIYLGPHPKMPNNGAEKKKEE